MKHTLTISIDFEGSEEDSCEIDARVEHLLDEGTIQEEINWDRLVEITSALHDVETPSSIEPCDECSGMLFPEEKHDEHCSLNPKNAAVVIVAPPVIDVTPAERVKRAMAIYQYLHDLTLPYSPEEKEAVMGDSLLLLSAILRGERCQWRANRAIVQFLESGFPESWVWSYIDVEGGMKASKIQTLRDQGFDRSVVIPFYGVRVGCSQCAAAVINGVPCHETGCPNAARRAATEEYVND